MANLIASVKKLKKLDVSDEDIISHLGEVGVDREQAVQLINQAKLAPDTEEEKSESSSPISKSNTPKQAPGPMNWLSKRLKADKKGKSGRGEKGDKLLSNKESWSSKLGPAPAPPKQVPSTSSKPSSPKNSSVDISGMWEKGVLSSVNEKLDEVKKIRNEFQQIVAAEADKVAKQEVDKIQVLFESQQNLFLEKVKGQLDTTSKEVEELIDKKIAEMRAESTAIKQDIDKLEKKEEQYQASLKDGEAKLAEIGKVKNQLISEMNSELIRAKSANQEFLENLNAKVAQLDDRVNKTLDVGLKVVEGLKADANSKLNELAKSITVEINHDVEQRFSQVDRMVQQGKEEMGDDFDTRFAALDELMASKSNDLTSKIEQGLKRLDGQLSEESKKLSEQLEEGLSLVEERFKNKNIEVNKSIDEKLALLDKMARLRPAKARGTQSKDLSDLEEKLAAKLIEVEKLAKNLEAKGSSSDLKKQAKDLEQFKIQFIKVIELNVDKFNKAIKHINSQVALSEEQINKRIELIDKKMRELDEFEITFAKEMGLIADKGLNPKPGAKK